MGGGGGLVGGGASILTSCMFLFFLLSKAGSEYCFHTSNSDHQPAVVILQEGRPKLS